MCQKSHMSHHVISKIVSRVLKMSAFLTNASAQMLTPLARFNDRVTQSGPLAVDASFQFVDVRDLGTIDSLPKHSPHDVVNWVTADFQ